MACCLLVACWLHLRAEGCSSSSSIYYYTPLPLNLANKQASNKPASNKQASKHLSFPF